MKPTFIGIGAQKCASSWLYDILADHPGVCVSHKKELDYFSYYYDHGYQWYERHFEHCQNEPAIGEVSPSYFYFSDVPKRIHQYAKDMRIVLTLRDPIERALSNHRHEIRVGHFTGPDISFEAGLVNNPTYIEQGLYATQLLRWLEYFPPEQILVVLMDDILADPPAVARKLYKFLGVDDAHLSAALDSRSNLSYVFRYKALGKCVDAVRFATRKIGFGWAWNLLGAAGGQKIYRTLNWQSSDVVIPPIKEQTRQMLRELYHDEIMHLEKLLGRSLAEWR